MSFMSNSPLSVQFKPPMKNGVGASKVFLPQLDILPNSIFEYLCAHFAHIEASEWQQRFDDDLVMDRHGRILSTQSGYVPNQHIYYYRFLKQETHVPFQEKILFENNDLLVVDKPHFLTMSPTGQYVQETLLVRLKNTTGYTDLTPIHRLDRETAGVVLFSKRPETRGAYQQLFAERKVHKVYQAIAPYRADLIFPLRVELRMDKGEPFYTMQVVEGQPNSHTEISLIDHDQIWALYQLKPATGKQHQLRVHLNHLNIPIKNDQFYPRVTHKSSTDFSSPLQLLAKEIYFTDPLNQQPMHFCSELVLTL